MNYVSNLSGGKDSEAMTLGLIEKGYPLTHVIFYDSGMEFKAIYNVIDKTKPLIEDYGAKLIIVKPERDFLFDMLLKPVCAGTDKEHYGYEWCGGCARWQTRHKVNQINTYLATLGDYVQYVGIASDEPQRIKNERNKVYPLVDWGWTEKDCLQYCYNKGFNWNENGVELYDILDRVSCWCCGNKNLKELRNIYKYLPEYWQMLRALQSRIDRPFRRDGKTIFDLEERFKWEESQMNINDYGVRT